MTHAKKLTLQFVFAWLAVLAGLVLIFLSFVVPPTGEIHASVLAAFGEILTFAGAVMGIDYSYRKKMLMRGENNEENNEDKQK